jgi:hypothetical protein
VSNPLSTAPGSGTIETRVSFRTPTSILDFIFACIPYAVRNIQNEFFAVKAESNCWAASKLIIANTDTGDGLDAFFNADYGFVFVRSGIY